MSVDVLAAAAAFFGTNVRQVSLRGTVNVWKLAGPFVLFHRLVLFLSDVYLFPGPLSVQCVLC